MGDNQESLPGLPKPAARRDDDEGERTTEARLKEVDRRQLLLRTLPALLRRTPHFLGGRLFAGEAAISIGLGCLQNSRPCSSGGWIT